jgi:hypothetical protein
MFSSRESKPLTQDSNQVQYYQYPLSVTSIGHSISGSLSLTQPYFGSDLSQNTGNHDIMNLNDELDEGYDGTLDDLQFAPQPMTLSEEPDYEHIRLEEFKARCKAQEQERLWELKTIYPDIEAVDLQEMLSTLQGRSSVRHKRHSAAHQGGITTQRSGKLKQPQSYRGRSTQSVSSTRGRGTGAKRGIEEGQSGVRRSFVVTEQGEVTVNNSSEIEGGKEQMVDEIEQSIQGISLNAR